MANTKNLMGFEVYASDEQLINFILAHKDTVKKLEMGEHLVWYCENMHKDIANPKEDFFDWPTLNGIYGIYGVVSDVIYKETGTWITYFEGGEDNDVIGTYLYRNDIRKPSFKLTCERYMKELNPALVFDEDIKLLEEEAV